MKVEKKFENDVLFITILGRLDTMTAPEFEKEVENLEGAKEIILDLKELDYLSSAGLRILLKMQKTMIGKGSMKLRNVKPNIMEIFEITGFTDFLTVE